MADVAAGWYPDPAGRWQVRWWDGSRWTDHVASGSRRGNDPAPGGGDTADLVNRVVGAALGFVELNETLALGASDADVIAALWRDAESRRDILLLARGHLEALEEKGSDAARAKAVTYLTKALDNPPLMPR